MAILGKQASDERGDPNHSRGPEASELRSFVSKFGDGAQVRRLLAIALVLDGHSRAEAAEQNGMDRQTLSDWVHRYNANGIDGLKSYHGPGATPLLTEAEKAELKALVVKGPDPEKDKVIRWRCLDLRIYRWKSPVGSLSGCLKARWENGCANLV